MKPGALRVLMLALAAGLPAGCATAPRPEMARLSYTGVDCATTPDLLVATSLTPLKDKSVWEISHPIDSSSPCLEWEGHPGPYAVFAMPEGGWTAPIEIGAGLDIQRIFSPHVVLLAEDGTVLRQFTPEHYNFRSTGLGQVYSVQFIPAAEERYVLVTSNPLRIGTSHDGITTGIDTTMIYTGFGAMWWSRGVETRIARGFSYEGPVVARVFRQEKAPKE